MSRLIKIDAKNFNKHTEEGEKLLEKSVKEVGVIESITTDINGEIITGNARKKVFDKLGLKPKFVKLKEDEYPVIETDLDGEKRVKAAILANTVAEKNINLDVELIKEVAVQYDIDIIELGVEAYKHADLPEELGGLDLHPNQLPKIEGNDDTLVQRIIITYPYERQSELENLLGIKIEKIIYNINELLNE
jgi:ParB-like chromosome segregation protein Spo0J